MSFQVQRRSVKSARCAAVVPKHECCLHPVEVADDQSQSYFGLLPNLAKERFVGDASALFADE